MASWSIKETKNTSSLYEITIKASGGGESASWFYSFKKGDGTYIECGEDESGKQIVDYERLYKMR